MMYNQNILPFGWHLHWIFIGLLIIGAILFVRWAFISLSKEQVKDWAIWLIIIGTLGMVLTSNWGFEGMRYMHSSFNNNSNWMTTHMFDDEYKNFNTPEEWREHMLEEMEEHMGINN